MVQTECYCSLELCCLINAGGGCSGIMRWLWGFASRRKVNVNTDWLPVPPHAPLFNYTPGGVSHSLPEASVSSSSFASAASVQGPAMCGQAERLINIRENSQVFVLALVFVLDVPRAAATPTWREVCTTPDICLCNQAVEDDDYENISLIESESWTAASWFDTLNHRRTISQDPKESFRCSN